MLYIKALMHKISYKKQVTFLILFIVFAITQKIFSTNGFFEIIKAVLPVLCIGLAVMYLQIYKKSLGAHGLILFSIFARYLFNTLTSLVSLEFTTLTFINPLDGFEAIGAVIAIYLILFFISLAMNEKAFKFEFNHLHLILLVTIYIAFRYSLEYLFFSVFLMFFVASFELKPALYMFLLSYVITTPFLLMDLVIDRVGFTILTYWMFTIYGLCLLVLLSTGLFKSLDLEDV